MARLLWPGDYEWIYLTIAAQRGEPPFDRVEENPRSDHYATTEVAHKWPIRRRWPLENRAYLSQEPLVGRPGVLCDGQLYGQSSRKSWPRDRRFGSFGTPHQGCPEDSSRVRARSATPPVASCHPLEPSPANALVTTVGNRYLS